MDQDRLAEGNKIYGFPEWQLNVYEEGLDEEKDF